MQMIGQQNSNNNFGLGFIPEQVQQVEDMQKGWQDSGSVIHTHGPEIENFDLKQNLTLAHLTRSDVQMLLYKRGLGGKGTDDQLQEKLADVMLQSLGRSWSGGSVGICSPCRENAIVVYHKNGLYVWGGRLERSWVHISEFDAFPQDAMWRYDLIHACWSQQGTFPAHLPRTLGQDLTGHSAVVYEDKIWMFGGLSGDQSTYLTGVMIFDTVSCQWELQAMAGEPLTPRGWHQAVVLGDNMIIYGHNGECRQQADNPDAVFVFNFTNRVWSMERCSMRGGRASEHPYHEGVLAMTTLNGKIYVMSCDLRAQGNGNNNNNNNNLFGQEQNDPYPIFAPPLPLIDLDFQNFNQIPQYGFNGGGNPAAAVAAGNAPSQYVEIHELDFESKSWKKINPKGTAPLLRFGCAAAHVGDTWLIHGGLLADLTVSKQVYTYNFVHNEWSCQEELSDTLLPRVSHKAVTVRDSVWLMMGTGQYNGNAQQFIGGLRGGGPAFNWPPGAPYIKQVDCIWLKAQPAIKSEDLHIINTDVERGLQKLQESDELSDLVLKCTDGEFRAHRAVLAANSEIFRAMFQHGMIETQDQCVYIEDANSSAVKVMLDYMYGGMTLGWQLIISDLLVPSFKLSDKYHITGLREACLSRIMQSLNLEQVCQYVQLASAHHCTELYQACVKAAGQNSETIKCMLQSVGYLQLMQDEPELMQKFMVDVVSSLKTQTNWKEDDKKNTPQEASSSSMLLKL